MNTKYLIVLEGEFPVIIKGKENMENYLKNKAEERKDSKGVDLWLEQMLECWFSQLYTRYPEFVLPFDNVIER